MTLQVGSADVLAVAGTGVMKTVIGFAQWLQHKPDQTDHVVIVTHQDAQGRWMGIAGHPGGVALCDVSPYLDNRLTRGNHDQPKPDDQNQVATFLGSCTASLGLAYDWVAFAADALDALDLHVLSDEVGRWWQWPTGNQLPGHVVCSSLAAALYKEVGWSHPNLGDERYCEPADWWTWNNSKGWAP